MYFKENQEGRYVYILDEKSLPKLVYIKTMGQTDDGNWIISEGLKRDDKIITSGILKVIPGMPVKIVQSTQVEESQKVKKIGFFEKLIRKFKK